MRSPAAPSPARAAPGPGSDAILSRDAALVWHGFTQMASYAAGEPLVVERAEGRELLDAAGRRYFDAISSLWLVTLGHRVPELDEALRAQLDKVAQSTMLGNSNRAVVELAESLAAVVPVASPHFLFAADGSSAVEQALKIAFQYFANQGAPERRGFLALTDAYHGDTIGSLSLGDGGFGTAVFDPLRFPVSRAPGYRDANWADGAIEVLSQSEGELCAVVLEPLVQAAGGMLVSDPGELARFCAAVRASGALLVVDEVATGFGRTGSLFALEQAGVSADLLCLGKGITGGYLPMSATVASGEVFSAFLGEDLSERTFSHGHSYGGNALAAAVASAHLALFREREILEHVREVAAVLAEALGAHVAGRADVAAVRQCGLMIGVELAGDGAAARARRACAAAVRRGVLLRSLGAVIPIVPPLTTTASEAEHVVAVLAESLDEVANPGPGK